MKDLAEMRYEEILALDVIAAANELRRAGLERIAMRLDEVAQFLTAEPVPTPQYVPEGRIIIRTNADATLDEAILKDGKANFHLEQMSATHWWMALTLDQQRIDINLTSRATIKANVSDEGEVKLIDDSCAISGQSK